MGVALQVGVPREGIARIEPAPPALGQIVGERVLSRLQTGKAGVVRRIEIGFDDAGLECREIRAGLRRDPQPLGCRQARIVQERVDRRSLSKVTVEIEQGREHRGRVAALEPAVIEVVPQRIPPPAATSG